MRCWKLMLLSGAVNHEKIIMKMYHEERFLSLMNYDLNYF
jgi:hypothetical protein